MQPEMQFCGKLDRLSLSCHEVDVTASAYGIACPGAEASRWLGWYLGPLAVIIMLVSCWGFFQEKAPTLVCLFTGYIVPGFYMTKAWQVNKWLCVETTLDVVLCDTALQQLTRVFRTMSLECQREMETSDLPLLQVHDSLAPKKRNGGVESGLFRGQWSTVAAAGWDFMGVKLYPYQQRCAGVNVKQLLVPAGTGFDHNVRLGNPRQI